MEKKVTPRFKTPPYQPTQIRNWRKKRGLSLEVLAERIGMTHASLSRVERGFQAYKQPMLELLADELRCSPADLLMRNPLDPKAPWSLLDSLAKLKPEQMRQTERFIKAILEEEAA